MNRVLICCCFLNGLLAFFYNTSSGLYEAKLVTISTSEDTNYVYKLESIPYAEIPQRFQRSVIRRFSPGKKKTSVPIICPQLAQLSSYGPFILNKQLQVSEDCLTITLYIPIKKDYSFYQNMSVVIHIHGGSNLVGGAAFFDGSVLASQGKIIVAIVNFRLGILGFLNGGTLKYPGNNGIWDQIIAIKWIKKNCEVLGCKPNSITLWGHSAGASDSVWLALSSQSNNLFQRVIAHSGNAFSYWSFDKSHEDRLDSFVEFFNCSNKITTMEKLITNCLENIELNKLFNLKFAYLLDMIGPSNDGFLGENSIFSNATSAKELIRSKNNNIKNIEIMTGTNSLEGFIFHAVFSKSVKYWTQNHLSFQIILTLERFSLFFRDKCKQKKLLNTA